MITTLIPDASQTAQHHILNNQVPLFSVFSLFFHGSVFDHCAEIKQKTSKTDKMKQKQKQPFAMLVTQNRDMRMNCAHVSQSPAHRQQVWRFEYSILLSGLNSADGLLPKNFQTDSY